MVQLFEQLLCYLPKCRFEMTSANLYKADKKKQITRGVISRHHLEK